jgi:hypothetical protein
MDFKERKKFIKAGIDDAGSFIYLPPNVKNKYQYMLIMKILVSLKGT